MTRYKFMYMHGRKPIKLTPDEMGNIKGNLQTGGLLFVDAACNEYKAWKEFDKSFRDTMETMWGKKLVVIPQTSGDGKDEQLFKIARRRAST